MLLKFIYSEKATKFCEIFPLLLTQVTTVHTVKSKGKISQNFVAFSEYMNFTLITPTLPNVIDNIKFYQLFLTDFKILMKVSMYLVQYM